MNASCAVIVFTKYPNKGNVKTRLAKTTGDQFATEFYKLCAEKIFSEMLKLDSDKFKTIIFCSDKDEIELFSDWLNGEFNVKPQTGNSLGERMSAAFKDVFNGGFSHAIIIGTDQPDISAKVIEQVNSKLLNYDFVIGPSADGGYYLLGMKNLLPEVFDGIEWSSSSVLNSTIEKVNALTKTHFLLDEKIDIDTEEDLNLWMKRCKDNTNPVYRFVENLYKK